MLSTVLRTIGGFNKCHCYNTITMAFIKTSNCNTVDNIYVKTCKCLGSQNEQSDIANKYSSSLKMTRVSRNMSL